MPAVVYLLCGLTGSGKTPYAKRLEAGTTQLGYKWFEMLESVAVMSGK